ncbi:ATP-binding protein [Poseidonocella sedimentorum]|uniref:ATP-binding protein n=1 Tax=Poseidonocella sedimentorum TaxID=871652 RepID=UPI0015A6FC97|nr:adenylate/guanylate cyclase domain-containing protein [Poseidonocella sedimentorum]
MERFDQAPEQRVLTVLFVDFVGSTALAQSRDLDSYDDTISGFHELAETLINTYHGMVLQRYGDGVLACFGLTEDGEDAAVAAIACGLSMIETAPRRLDGHRVRVGIDSGQVMCRVGQQGALLPMITGLHVNRAARLQECAGPGQLTLSGETRDFISRLVTLDGATSDFEVLKGIDRPVEVVRVTRFAFRPGTRTGDLLIAREPELDRIAASLARPGGVSVIEGPPGIGKSALVAEAMRRADPRPVLYLAARQNLRRTGLMPFATGLRPVLGLPHNASSERLGQALRTFDIKAGEEDLALLAQVFIDGAPPVPHLTLEQQRLRRGALLADLLGHAVSARGGIIVFDDLHWADSESLGVLEQIARSETHPINILATTRPASQLADLIERMGAEKSTLGPLAPPAALRLLDETTDLSEARKDEILRAAEGNPLFLVALADRARQLSGDGGATPLPQSVEATFQAIISGFGAEREIILTAAVLGREFPMEHLQLLHPERWTLEDELRVLTLNGLLNELEEGFSFSHVLLRDAAYNMLPRARRREIHARLATRLQAEEPGYCAAYPEVLADHLIAARAHDAIPGAAIAAGIKMLRNVNFDAAISYFEEACEDVEDQARRSNTWHPAYISALTLLASARMQRLGFAHPDVLKEYEKLELAIGLARGTDRERCIALYGLFAHRMLSGRVRDCGAIIKDMRALDDGASDEITVLRLVNETAYHFYAGEFEAAEKAGRALKEIYDVERHGLLFLEIGADPLASVRSVDVQLAARSGRVDHALKLIEETVAHLKSIGAISQLPWIHIFGGSALHAAGALDEAERQIAIGHKLAEEQAANFWSFLGQLWQLLLPLDAGETGAIVDEFEALLVAGEQMGVQLNYPIFWTILAKARAIDGHCDAARKWMIRARELLDRHGEGQHAEMIAARNREIDAILRADARYMGAIPNA